MAKRNLYIVRNEGTSPVCITTKDTGYCIEGGQSIPLSMEELIYLNGTTPVFRNGLLFFDREEEEAIYDELKIHNWKDILHNSDIENLILHPTYDGLRKIIGIESISYFERIRGVHVGLINAGVDINNKVSAVIAERQKEFRNQKIKSAIVLSKTEPVEAPSAAEVAAMSEQIARLQAMVENLSKASSAPQKKAEPSVASVPAAKKETDDAVAKKPAAKKTATKKPSAPKAKN